MDTNGKTGNLNRSGNTSVQRLTPSELRERLFQEQEARIAELVKHNAELTKAMEHEREQSRLHAEANAKALELLETTTKQLSAPAASSPPVVNVITSTTANLIPLALLATLPSLYGVGKAFLTTKYPMMTALIRWEDGIIGLLVLAFGLWAYWAYKTKNLREDVAGAFIGGFWSIAAVFNIWQDYDMYRYHSLETTIFDDVFNIFFVVIFSFASYSNWRLVRMEWKQSGKAMPQNQP